MGAKALLVGINAYPTMPLRGCLNDVENIRTLIQQRYNLAGSDMRVLRDQEATKANIEEHLRWLAQSDGDGAATRLFHYSGHGTFIADNNGDEPDGRDEALVPYDFATSGGMSDDSLRALYTTFGPDTQLLLIMDCCHSGSIQRNVAADVFYRFLPNSQAEQRHFDEIAQRTRAERDAYVLEQVRDLRVSSVEEEEWEQRVKAAMAKFDKQRFGLDTVPGNVVLLSACRADQTAADASLGNSYNGAFTYYLTEVLRQASEQIDYHTLIEQVGRRLYDSEFLQIPQLECSEHNRACSFLNITL